MNEICMSIIPVLLSSAAIFQNAVDAIIVPRENMLTKGKAASFINGGTANLPVEIMPTC